MIIHLPDPYPGRCKNLRPAADPDGYPITLRCLDYENTPHVCTFPPAPEPRLPRGWDQYSSIKGDQEPAPWVKP